MLALALAANSTCLGTPVGVVLRIISMSGSNAHLLVLLRILWFRVSRFSILMLLLDQNWARVVALPTLGDALAVDTFSCLIPPESKSISVSATVHSLPVWESLIVFFVHLVASCGFINQRSHLHLVHWVSACLYGRMVRLGHVWSVAVLLSGINRVFGAVSTNSTFGCFIAGSVSLSLWYCLLDYSVEISSNILSTFIDIWINNSIGIIGMMLTILVHQYRLLVLVLSMA